MARSPSRWAWLLGSRLAFGLATVAVLVTVTAGTATVTRNPAVVFGVVTAVAAGCVVLGHAGSWWFRSRRGRQEPLGAHLRDRLGRILIETALVVIGAVALVVVAVGYLVFP